MVFLPQEIINQFAFHLRSNKTALARARLVSRAWDAACVAHLFYHIEFKVIDPFGCAAGIGDYSKATVATETQRLQKRYSDLLDLLTSSPLLSHATKEVTIMRAHRLESSAWGTHEETYGDVLRQLKGVQVVRLKEVHFSHLSPSFVDALIGACESGSVTHLEIVGCENGDLGNLIRIMRSLSSLQHLSLLLVCPTNPIDIKKSSNVFSSSPHSSLGAFAGNCTSPFRPTSLFAELGNLQIIADWLRYSPPLLDLSCLRELRCCKADPLSQIHPDDLDNVFESCASSLEMWEISVSTTGECTIPPEDFEAVFRLERFPQLRHLVVTGLRLSKDTTVNLVHLIPAFLSTAAANTRLSVLTTMVNVESSKGGSEIDWDCWAPIDEYLSDAKRFPFFECLDVALVVRKRRYALAHVSSLKERLWRLVATNRVRISVEL